MNKYTFYVSGTHCTSCKILIEDIFGEHDFIKKVNVDLKSQTIQIETDSDKGAAEIADIINEKIKPHGYALSLEKKTPARPAGGEEKKSDDVIWKAIPIGLFVLALFFLLQKSGVLNLGLGGKTTVFTSFFVGLIASVSSCLAVVGGLVLSLSAKVSEDKVSDTKNFVLFHVGRLVSFAILGGALGLIGNAIGINFIFSATLGIFAAIVMLLLGFNLVGVMRKNKVTLPAGLFNFFRRIEHKTFTPLILGFATFFLPCGFTQSMQVAALGTGSFTSGLLLMFFFALGTFPMLALLSFGSASFAHSKHAPLFLKSAGVVVIGLGLFALLSGLAGLGIINPIFSI
jgi:uncharacterized protein